MVLVVRTDGKRTLGNPRRGKGDNIKVGLRDMGRDMDWIGLAKDRDSWRVPVNAVMNLQVA